MRCYSVLCRDTKVLLINLAFFNMSSTSRLGVNLVALELVHDGPRVSACGPSCCCVTQHSPGRAGQRGAVGADSRPWTCAVVLLGANMTLLKSVNGHLHL